MNLKSHKLILFSLYSKKYKIFNSIYTYIFIIYSNRKNCKYISIQKIYNIYENIYERMLRIHF